MGHYYYDGRDSKSLTKDIMRYFKIHAKRIVDDDTVVKTVVSS